jgi:hypothetical protein
MFARTILAINTADKHSCVPGGNASESRSARVKRKEKLSTVVARPLRSRPCSQVLKQALTHWYMFARYRPLSEHRRCVASHTQARKVTRPTG